MHLTTAKTKKQTFTVGSFQGQLRMLKDRDQFSDEDGRAEQAGVCSTNWSLFGQLWPASIVLAKAMETIELDERRILELGCGLGLPSMKLKYRGADITASDYNPSSGDFLTHNAQLNGLPEIPFLQLDWSNPAGPGHEYDLIIASDVLYDPGHPALLIKVIDHLAKPSAKVLISCPGRGYKNLFNRKMAAIGFTSEETPVPFEEDEPAPYKGRLLTYRRNLSA